jgi:hypothetical protein
VSESSHNTSVAFSVYDGDVLLSTETLSQEIIKIGRLQTSDIRLDDEKVSRRHAVIEVTVHHRPRLRVGDARQRREDQQAEAADR